MFYTLFKTKSIPEIVELHRRWLAGEPDGEQARFVGRNLGGYDFSGMDLRGADFRGAFLGDTDFSGADLRGADLSCVNALHTNFRGTNLRGACLRKADLLAAHLEGADLTDADLTYTKYVGKIVDGKWEHKLLPAIERALRELGRLPENA